MTNQNEHPTYLFEEVKAIQSGILVTLTHYAIAKNNGGVYLRFFADWMPMALMSVYESETWLLPPEWKPIIDHLQKDAPNLRAKKASPSETEEMKESGNYFLLPIPAQIVRYQYDSTSEDQNKKRWRFHAVYRFLPHLKKRFEQAQLPEFKSKEELIKWGFDQGKFLSLEDAQKVFETVKTTSKPKITLFPQMVQAWVRYVNQAQLPKGEK